MSVDPAHLIIHLLICSCEKLEQPEENYKNYLWPDGVVPYTFHESMISSQEARIHRAMEFITNKTCLKFVPRTDEPSYIIYRTWMLLEASLT